MITFNYMIINSIIFFNQVILQLLLLILFLLFIIIFNDFILNYNY